MAKKFLSKETEFFFIIIWHSLEENAPRWSFISQGLDLEFYLFIRGGGHQYLATSYLFMLMAQWAGTVGN